MINKQLNTLNDYLNMLKDGLVNCVLCYSQGGLGKTHFTIDFLTKNKVTYTYYTGVATPVALFKLLHDDNGKVIVLDDIDMLLYDERSISLLKSALWGKDGKRIVTYNTSSKTLEMYPSKFEFTGKIIILTNRLNDNNESISALLSRCLIYNLSYTLKELKQMSIEILEKRKLTEEQMLVAADIINEVKTYHGYNLRLFERMLLFIRYDIAKAKDLFFNSLEGVNGEDKIIADLMESGEPVDFQVKEFIRLTGKSRITFFRKKKAMKICGG